MSTRGSSLSLAILVAALVAGPTAAHAADDALAAALRAVYEANLDAYERMDVDATLKTLHSRSPGYKATQEMLSDDVPDPKVDAELVDFRYIGHDDEFAVARVKTKTAAVAGEKGFVDNTVDAIVLFHQEDGAWKLWDQQVLAIQTASK
jgi:hypothetical protein